jgi:nucleotide-binding universal stress UspA family protein
MTILVAYVPTPEGFAALDNGIVEAKLRSSSLTVINVTVGGNFAEVTSADDQHLDAVTEQLTRDGLSHEVVIITDAIDVADEVLKVADDTDAEMIVVGLHRRSPLGKALMGSTAQKIMLGANCPVLSVRPDDA